MEPVEKVKFESEMHIANAQWSTFFLVCIYILQELITLGGEEDN